MNTNTKDCCDTWAAAHMSGTDNAAFRALITDSKIGYDLPPVNFCPWCGAPKQAEQASKFGELAAAAAETLSQQRREFARGEISDLDRLEDAVEEIDSPLARAFAQEPQRTIIDEALKKLGD